MSDSPDIAEDDRKELVSLSLPTNNFISDFRTAQGIVQNAVMSHNAHWKLITFCDLHIDGQKPIPPEELKKKGLSWVDNFNYGKARAKAEKGVAESTAKISSALSLGYCTFRLYEEADRKDEILRFLEDDYKRGMVAAAIGYGLTHTLSRETRLSGWLNEVERPSYLHGYCALIFQKYDWMPTPVHPSKIAFRPGTRPDRITQYVTFKTMSAEDLYDRWITARKESYEVVNADGTPQKIASSGWSLTGLENLLLKQFRGKIYDNKTPENWSEVIPFYQKNPGLVMMNTEDARIAKIYHKELDGTLTEVYIPWGGTDVDLDEEKVKTIYENTNQVNNIIFTKNHGKYVQSMLIHLIRDSAFSGVDGFIHEYRGIAKFSVEDSIRYNRRRNEMGNKMKFVGSPMFISPNGQTAEKFKVTVAQGFILLPESHQLVEKQPAFDISSHIAVLRFEEQEFNRDTQQFDATIQGRLTSRPNRGEVQRVTEEVEFTDNAKSSVKMKDYAGVFYSVIKRMPSVKAEKGDVGYEGRRRFYDTIRKTLPWLVKTDADVDKLLGAIDSFVMEPIVGSIETITIAMQMAETPFARNRFKRMLLIAQGMPIEEVNFAAPLIQDRFVNLQDSRIATFENDMFFTTNEVVLSGTDDHITHLEVHQAKADRIIKGVQDQAISPIDAFKYLENNIIHQSQHLDLLQADPVLNKRAEEFFEIMKLQLQAKDQIKTMADQMLKQQQEMAAQPRIDPETQHEMQQKDYKAAADQQRKDFVIQSTTERKDRQMELTHEENLRKMELEAEAKKIQTAYQ